MGTEIVKQLDAIFKPKSIAVIGASNIRDKWGWMMLERPLSSGYRGALYPVNPGEKEVLGLTAYPNLAAIPGPVDLAVVTVPANTVHQVMRECIEKGVKAAVLITAGFAEVGQTALQDEVVRIAREGGIRIMGPNCMGLVSSEVKLSMSFFATPPRPGAISFLSQSGNYGTIMVDAANAKGYGLAKFASIGNQADLEAADFLEYLAQDNDTGAIVLYVEGFREGYRFFTVTKEAVKRKPVIVFKVGRTSGGARAALGHTASIAGSNEVFEAMCRQVGLIQVPELLRGFDVAHALVSQPLPRGNRIAIITGGGGVGVVTADCCLTLGLELPEFDPETQAALRKHLFPHAPPPRNPVDLGGAGVPPMTVPTLASCIAGLDYIDGLITAAPLTPMGSADQAKLNIDAAAAVAALPRKYGKPVIVLGRRHDPQDIYFDLIRRAGLPHYFTPEEAAWAMYGLVRYAQVRREMS